MKKEKLYDVIILGAGASGLMCASLLPKDIKILVIETNKNIGEKIKISGGGNCNITNENISYRDFVADKEFLQPILETFTSKDITIFFKNIQFKKQKDNQYFCVNGSSSIVEYFKNKTLHVKFAMEHKCLHVRKNEDIFTCICDKDSFTCKYFIVASGGLSYPKLGASSIGYEIAKSFNHKVTSLNPALVGFTVQKEEFWVKELSGISLPVKVTVVEREFLHDLLFSHKGFSGPAILNASLFWQKGKITINFLPQKHFSLYFKNQNKKQISSSLPLPKRFIKTFLKVLHVEDKPIYKLTKNECKILEKIHNYTFAPAGNFGYTKAEVTRGGVDTSEINQQTYESLKVSNLFFLGEVLDVTGRLGGYNFTFAFMSAIMLAKNFKKYQASLS